MALNARGAHGCRYSGDGVANTYPSVLIALAMIAVILQRLPVLHDLGDQIRDVDLNVYIRFMAKPNRGSRLRAPHDQVCLPGGKYPRIHAVADELGNGVDRDLVRLP